MPKFEPTFSLGQLILALSFVAGGASATLGFIYGTRGDIELLKYQFQANEKGDAARAVSADAFRTEVVNKLEEIRKEISGLRIEMQDKEPRKR